MLINELRTKDANEFTKQIIEYIYKKHNIDLPLNPIFREITQPKPGSGFKNIIERDKYKIYSKKIRENTYIKFYIPPNWKYKDFCDFF